MRGDTTLRHILAPIARPLEHPEVTDIVINEPHRVWIRRAGQWVTIAVPSFDFDTMDAATILIGQRTGREFDEANPYVNSTLPDGQRFQGVRPPGTKDGRILWAIRRPPTVARQIDDDDFEGLFASANQKTSRRQRRTADIGTLLRNREWTQLFRAARLAGLSIAFCGPTGAGKSDMVRRVIQIFRPGVRMATVETDDEFGEIGSDNKAPLFYDDTRITSDEAVRIALRLVPVEIFMQEVRGAEAYSLLRAMASGHNGATTWHADEGRELEALCMMARQHPAGRAMAEDRLMAMARNAFDLIAYCQRDDSGKFAVTSVRLKAAEQEAAA